MKSRGKKKIKGLKWYFLIIISVSFFVPSSANSEDKPLEKVISIFDLEPEFTKENIDIENIDFASFDKKWGDLHRIYDAQRLFYYKMSAKEALETLKENAGKLEVSEIKEKLPKFYLPENGYALIADFGKYDIYIIIDTDKGDIVCNLIYINPELNKAYEEICSKAFAKLRMIKKGMTEEEVKEICGEPDKVEDAAEKERLNEYRYLYRAGPRKRLLCGIVFSKKDMKTTGVHSFIFNSSR